MHGQHHHVWRAPAPACPRLISLASAISRNLLRVSQSLRGEGRTTWSSANTPPRPSHPFSPVRRALPDPTLSPPPRPQWPPQGRPFQEWRPLLKPPPKGPGLLPAVTHSTSSRWPHLPTALHLTTAHPFTIQAISCPPPPAGPCHLRPPRHLLSLPCSSLPSTGLGTSWGPVRCLALGHTDHPAPAPPPLCRVAERPECDFWGSR